MKKINVFLVGIMLIIAMIIGIVLTGTVSSAPNQDGSVFIDGNCVYNDTDDSYSFIWLNQSGHEWHYGQSYWYEINLKIDAPGNLNYAFQIQGHNPGWTIGIYNNKTGTDINDTFLSSSIPVDYKAKFVVTPPETGPTIFTKVQLDVYWSNYNGAPKEADNVLINFTGTVSELPFNILTNDVVNTYEDAPYSVNYDTTKDNDIAEWSLNTNATWLSIDSNGYMNGTPDNSDVGQYFVNATAFNGTIYGSHNFTLTVVNIEPDLTGLNILTATEDVLYSSDYDSSDDVLWYLDTDASWLSIDTNGILSGTPTENDAGDYYVNVSINDGNGGINHTRFSLTVSAVNDAPELVGSPGEDAYEDTLYAYEFDVTDIDSVDFQWTLSTDAVFLSLTGSNVLGTGGNDDVGSYFVNVTVSDGELYDFINYTLDVHNTNDIPVWVDTPDNITIDEGDTYTFDVNATDVDMDIITYDITGPSGIAINDTGLILWLSIAGNHAVVITASDSIETIEHTFIVTVVPEPVDKPEPVDNNTNITDDDDVDDDIVPADDDDDDINITDDDIVPDDDIIPDDDIVTPDDDIITDDDITPGNETLPHTGSKPTFNWLLLAGIIIAVLVLVIIVIVIIFIVVSKKKRTEEPQDHYPPIPTIEPEVEYSPGSPGIQEAEVAQPEQEIEPVELKPESPVPEARVSMDINGTSVEPFEPPDPMPQLASDLLQEDGTSVPPLQLEEGVSTMKITSDDEEEYNAE